MPDASGTNFRVSGVASGVLSPLIVVMMYLVLQNYICGSGVPLLIYLVLPVPRNLNRGNES